MSQKIQKESSGEPTLLLFVECPLKTVLWELGLVVLHKYKYSTFLQVISLETREIHK